MAKGVFKVNERIRELLEQATSSRTLSGGIEYDVRVDQEMFAELIVRECANACLNATTEDSPVHLVSVAYADNVKRHFGIEE
jgi:hypothetical protein